MKRLGCGIGLLALMMGGAADAQSVANMAALKGLAPVSALSNSTDGKAALASNFTVTGAIQTGVIRQPTLLPFAEQQQQALRDAFITDGNLAQLADGFGTTLGRRLSGARALSRSGALHQHLQVRLGGDRLRQLDIGIGFERRQIFLRQRHDERQKAGFRRGHGHLQGRSTARPILSAAPMAGRPERPAPTSMGIPARSRPSPRSCRSWDRTTSMFRRATRSITAGRS